MENGRVSSMAQLSAWTNTMKNFGSSHDLKSSVHAAAEDEYEEEFEDYEEEFEDETPAIAPSKHFSSSMMTTAKSTLDNGGDGVTQQR